jgi:hypothetical protein
LQLNLGKSWKKAGKKLGKSWEKGIKLLNDKELI